MATVTTIRFDHSHQTPGQAVRYRVCANRRKEFSAWSNEATVYLANAAPSVKLKMAA